MFLSNLRPWLILVFLFTFIACSEEESPSDTGGPEIPEGVEDTFNYVALTNDGILFRIGNNSGKVVRAGEIPGIDLNTMFNAVTSSDSETFVYEHRFDPPRGILSIWYKQTGETESTILSYPEGFGENTALLSLDWDEDQQNLVGITRENMEQDNFGNPIMVVRIDPENFQIVSQGIDLSLKGYENIFSTSLVGQKLYVVASKTDTVVNADLLEIDLVQDSITVLPFGDTETGIINIGNSGNTNTLFGFSLVANSNIMAEVRPVIYNLQTKTMSEITEVPQISALHFAHKTFYNKEEGEFAGLMGANNAKNLFTYNPSTGDHELIVIPNPEELSSLINIIGVEDL